MSEGSNTNQTTDQYMTNTTDDISERTRAGTELDIGEDVDGDDLKLVVLEANRIRQSMLFDGSPLDFRALLAEQDHGGIDAGGSTLELDFVEWDEGGAADSSSFRVSRSANQLDMPVRTAVPTASAAASGAKPGKPASPLAVKSDADKSLSPRQPVSAEKTSTAVPRLTNVPAAAPSRGSNEMEPTTPRSSLDAVKSKTVKAADMKLAEHIVEGTNDRVVLVRWVTKVKSTNHREANVRLLVVGRFRCYLVHKKWTGAKKSVDAHHLDLESMRSDSNDHVQLNYTRDYLPEKHTWVLLADNIAVDVLSTVGAQIRSWSHNFPPHKLPRVVVHASCTPTDKARIDTARAIPTPGPLQGFVDTYEAMCNYVAIAPSRDLLHYFKRLHRGGERTAHFELHEVENASNEVLVPLKPLAYALKYSDFFTGFYARNVARPTVLGALSVALGSNVAIRDIVVQSCQVKPATLQLLGAALTRNTLLNLVKLDVSGNAIGDKGLLMLIDGVRHLRHSLEYVSVADCALTHKSLAPLLFTFADVRNGALTDKLVYLNLSNNVLGSVGAHALCDWILACLPHESDVRTKGKKGAPLLHWDERSLRSEATESARSSDTVADARLPVPLNVLKMCNVGCKLGNVLEALVQSGSAAHLQQLDVSRNRLPSADMAALARLLTSSPVLIKIAVVDCHLTHFEACELIRALSGNTLGLVGVELDVSYNQIGGSSGGAAALVSALKVCSQLRSLNVRMNQFGTRGTADLLTEWAGKPDLPVPTVKELILSMEFVKRAGSNKHSIDVMDALDRLLTSPQCALTRLVMFGNPEKYALGTDLLPFLKRLPSYKTLVFLDVSGNLLGRAGIDALCAGVSMHARLRTLIVDNNAMDMQCLEALRKLVLGSSVLEALPFPRHDVRRLTHGKQGGSNYDRVKKIMSEIGRHLGENAKTRRDAQRKRGTMAFDEAPVKPSSPRQPPTAAASSSAAASVHANVRKSSTPAERKRRKTVLQNLERVEQGGAALAAAEETSAADVVAAVKAGAAADSAAELPMYTFEYVNSADGAAGDTNAPDEKAMITSYEFVPVDDDDEEVDVDDDDDAPAQAYRTQNLPGRSTFIAMRESSLDTSHGEARE